MFKEIVGEYLRLVMFTVNCNVVNVMNKTHVVCKELIHHGDQFSL